MGLNPRVIDLSLSGPEKTILEITLAGSGIRCSFCLKESPPERRRRTPVSCWIIIYGPDWILGKRVSFLSTAEILKIRYWPSLNF